jgi:heme ABC exporter ATP-binding subunit CcmA
MDFAIEAQQIHHAYGVHPVLRGVDLTLAPGKTLALMGANGAGKTTLLRILAGLLRPVSGELYYFGAPLKGNETEIRRRLGVVSHQLWLYPDLTAAENLTLFARLYSLEQIPEKVTRALASVGLVAQRQTRVRSLSRGMQQRLALARAWLHEPPVLLLDEPFSGVDTASTTQIMTLLHQKKQEGSSIVLVSHSIAEVAALADEVIFLHRGQVASTITGDALSEQCLQEQYLALLAEAA